jgi:uncharacterized protein YggE
MIDRPFPRALFVAIVLACSLGAARAEDAPRPGIETTGEAGVSAKPDFATVTIGVQTAGRTAQGALADNSKATAALIEALKNDGVAANDIQTSDFSIWPQMASALRSGPEPSAIVGYSVSNRVKATLHDLTRLGDVLDKAVTAGANSVNGIQFGFANETALLDDARKSAFADARRKADLYAAAAGVKILGLQSLEETTSSAPAFLKTHSLERASVPIETGESTLSVGVRARFDIAR